MEKEKEGLENLKKAIHRLKTLNAKSLNTKKTSDNMKVKLKVKNKKFEVKGKFLGVDILKWDNQSHNKFRISVKNLRNNKTISFTFWDSYINYVQGKTELTKEDLIYCFKILLDEALMYVDNKNIDSFYQEFGGETISEILRAYKGCKKQFENCLKLGLTENEIRDMLNEIIQKENENKLMDLVIE